MLKTENENSMMNTSSMLNIDLIEESSLNETELKELSSLYEEASEQFKAGKIIVGKVVTNDDNGVLVDISYKSNGLIPNHEFSPHESKKYISGSHIEVVLDRLEDENGTVVLSYQQAKSIKTWERIAEIAEKGESAIGIVTHKVKGGLSVDIGIPAFLPGSQVDLQRVTNFDQFVGQEVECKILKINKKRGNVIISRRKYLEEQRYEDRKQALSTLQEGQVVQGIVKNITNYGVFVDIGGIDGLLHITDMSWGRISHPSELVKIGDSASVKILSFDKEREKISLGMKQLAENPWDTVEDKYTIGSKINGTVSSITDYGLFIEVEKGIEGLVHISEISWTDRITNLSKHFSEGDKIETVVVALDKDNRRMSLSIKQLKEDPWKTVATQFNDGDKISGTISNITDFGIFVQIAEGIDGLVHVSDISWTNTITHPGDLYKKGDSIETVILSVDPENRKISLGVKQLNEDPWTAIEEEYPVGKIIEGIVSKITNFGAFIKLPTGIEGLVHISELSEKEVEKVEDVLSIGKKTDFKVIKINKDERKLGLSIKALSEKTPIAQPAKTEAKTKAPQKKAAIKAKPSANKVKTAEHKKARPTMSNSLQQALADHAARNKDKKENK
jgi:small subunit ribosomal protein S1